MKRRLTSDKGEEILSGGGDQPPIAARHLSAQRALMPVHVARQEPELPRARPARLHQLVRVRQAACVDALRPRSLLLSYPFQPAWGCLS